MSIDLEKDLRTYVVYLDSVATEVGEAEGDVLVLAGSQSSPSSVGNPRAWVAVAAGFVVVLGDRPVFASGQR